jgi:hypothetical protein
MTGCTRPHRQRPRQGSGPHAPLRLSLFDLIRWGWAADLGLWTTQDHLRGLQRGAPRLCCDADAGVLSHLVSHASQRPSGVRQPQTAGPPADDRSLLGPKLRRDVLGEPGRGASWRPSTPSASDRLHQVLTVCACAWTIAAMSGALILCSAATRIIGARVRQRTSLVVR